MNNNIVISNISKNTVRISIEGVIGDQISHHDQDDNVSTYEDFKRLLQKIEKIESAEIVVDIRSTGGNVNDALLIHDAIVATGAQVTTRCFGYVASAATIIAQAASQGLRQISSNALYLIHNSVSATQGNAQDISQTAELLKKTDQTIANIYAARSERSTAEFTALMAENSGNGRWLSPQEVVELGLADTIIDSSVIENIVDFSRRRLNSLWNKLVEALGVEPDDEFDQDETNTEGRLSAKVETENRAEGSNEDKAEAVAGLEDTSGVEVTVENAAVGVAVFKTAEALQARSRARASATSAAEDPAIDDSRRKDNMSAYYEDAMNF